MGVNETGTTENTLRDTDAVQQTTDGIAILVPLYNTTATVKANSVTLFALDALGGSLKNIKFGFYLDADAAATFIISVHKTRPGDLITFTQDLTKTWTIATPAAAGWYTYEAGDLEQGLQMEIRIAQDNAGDATNLCDATLTYEGGI